MEAQKKYNSSLIYERIEKLIGEATDDKYTHIGYGHYKLKGKEKDPDAIVFSKEGNKYIPTKKDDTKAKAGTSKEPDKPKVNIFDKPKSTKKHKSKDDVGIRTAEAIYNNVSAIEDLVMKNNQSPNEVIPVMGPVLVNAIKATINHKFKPTAGNEDKLKEFYNELKELLKVTESLVKRPSKDGVKKLVGAHRNWWNYKHGGTIVLNADGPHRANIIESTNRPSRGEYTNQTGI